MKLEVALPVLGLLLCVADTTAQQSADTTAQQSAFEVVISRTKVTVTCPFQSETGITWKKGSEQKKGGKQTYEIEEYNSSKDDGFYECSLGDNSARLYLKAKVAGVIIADLLITLGVLILVYYFSKNRKGRVGGSAGVHPRGPKMVRPPPVPNPDYEPIRKGQRDVYAGLQSKGF
ncbi:T-cell surface glycoprotein CD3 epsilon chain isoform 2-T4 [Pangshura tecta]